MIEVVHGLALVHLLLVILLLLLLLMIRIIAILPIALGLVIVLLISLGTVVASVAILRSILHPLHESIVLRWRHLLWLLVGVGLRWQFVEALFLLSDRRHRLASIT